MILRTTLSSELEHCDVVLGDYRVGKASQLSDPDLLAMAQEYRRAASSRMIPIERRDILSRMPAAEYHVSRKIDGEFTLVIWRQGQLFTINPGGTVRVGMPWHSEAIELLEKAGIQDAVIAGELYGSPREGRRPRVHDIVSMARQPRDGDLDRIRFAVFDMVEMDGASYQGRFTEAWKNVERIFEKVGEALDLSSVQMQSYMEAASKSLEACIARGPKPESSITSYQLADGRNDEFIGKYWLKRPDGTVINVLSQGPAAIKSSTRPASHWKATT